MAASGARTPIVVTHDGGVRFTAQVRGHRIVVDQPERAGGADTGPAPIELLGASLGTCVALYVQQFCQARGLSSAGMRVEVMQLGAQNPNRIGEFGVRWSCPTASPTSTCRCSSAWRRAARHTTRSCTGPRSGSRSRRRHSWMAGRASNGAASRGRVTESGHRSGQPGSRLASASRAAVVRAARDRCQHVHVARPAPAWSSTAENERAPGARRGTISLDPARIRERGCSQACCQAIDVSADGNRRRASIALPELDVAGSNPVSRSRTSMTFSIRERRCH
jgi:hypothetical protein